MNAIREVLNDEQWETFNKPVAVELKAGEASFHHPLLVHGSRENRTDGPRRAVVINVFRDGVKSDSSDELLAGVPPIEPGRKMEGTFLSTSIQSNSMIQKVLEETTASRILRLDTSLLATVCGMLSAVGYTAANICLRYASDLDPVWVSCIKAVPTLMATAPFMISQLRAGTMFPSWRVFVIILLAGLVGQVGGNVMFQWSLGRHRTSVDCSDNARHDDRFGGHIGTSVFERSNNIAVVLCGSDSHPQCLRPQFRRD